MSDLRDKKGRAFDPEIHKVDASGNPVLNNDGSLKCMAGFQHKTHTEHKVRRRNRSEQGPTLRLAAEKRDGYQRRWTVDEPGKIDKLTKHNDYEHVLGDDGKPIRAITGVDGTGKQQYSYLLEIPMEFHLADKAEAAKRIPDPHKMKEALPGENEYIPGGGESALR